MGSNFCLLMVIVMTKMIPKIMLMAKITTTTVTQIQIWKGRYGRKRGNLKSSKKISWLIVHLWNVTTTHGKNVGKLEEEIQLEKPQN